MMFLAVKNLEQLSKSKVSAQYRDHASQWGKMKKTFLTSPHSHSGVANFQFLSRVFSFTAGIPVD